MPVSLTTVTGPIYLPNGATPVGGRVSFELSSWDLEEGEGLIVTGPVYSPIDENGQFTVNLFTSTVGTNSVSYRMFVIWEDSELSESYVNNIYVGVPTPHYTKKYIGSFVLSGPGPFQVSDLNIVSETDNSSFDVYLEMKAFADRIDLGDLDSAVLSTNNNATATAADRLLAEEAAERAEDAALIAQQFTNVISLPTMSALRADTTLTYTLGQLGTVTVGQYLRTGDGYSVQIVDSSATNHNGQTSFPTTPVKWVLIGPWNSGAFANTAEYAAAVESANSSLVTTGQIIQVKSGEVVTPVCNPSEGDNFQSLAYWQSMGHTVHEDGVFHLKIADGSHNLTTFVDITDGRHLELQGTSGPDFCTITGATFVDQVEAQATASAVVASGSLTSITPDFGGKYFSMRPTVTISGGGGIGATAVAVMTAGANGSSTVTGYTITNVGSGYSSAPTITVQAPPTGEVYLATVNVDPLTPLPSIVQTNVSVGFMNVRGDGGADLLNGASKVVTRVSDTQFTCLIRVHGVVPTAFTTPSNPTPLPLGLLTNRLVVNKACLLVNEAGWDGAAREGFMNVLRGGKIRIRNLSFSYIGLRGDNDMFFASGSGSEIDFMDYVVADGTGEMLVRSVDLGAIRSNRSFFGGGVTGSQIWQGSKNGFLLTQRTLMNSVSGDAISASQGAKAAINLSMVVSANQGGRTTYADACISFLTSIISRCNLGVQPVNGKIVFSDTGCEINNTITPISITGNSAGEVHGSVAVSGNVNPLPNPYEIQPSRGVYCPGAERTYDPRLLPIYSEVVSLNFTSIPAHDEEELVVPVTGALFGMDVSIERATTTMPAEGIMYDGFVSSDGFVTVRCINYTASPIDPANALIRVKVKPTGV